MKKGAQVMSYRRMAGCALVLASLLVISMGCPRGPSRVFPSPINASAAGAKAIELYDANKDGKLTGAELDKCPGLRAALTKVDPANEGVTADKITARIQEWQKSKLGRMSLACTITRNGAPFEGADVRFVPEKFLGLEESKWTAIGKSDQNGMVMLNVPSTEPNIPPGVPPGFYRVEITKAGMTVPAKYNTETVLGQEAANDAKGILEGIRFDLKF
jgi:hypothetical protein